MAPHVLSENPKGALRTLVLATVASNFAIGLPLGSFGVSVVAIQQEFATTRGLASAGASLALLAFGLMGPVVPYLIERFSIRSTMLAGIILGSTGYVALWAAPNIWAFLAAFLLLVGPGAVMSGNFPASILINNWFRVGTGRAIGIMMMPIFIMLVPLASSPIIASFGLRALYLVLGAVNLLLIPLLMLVKDRPHGTSDEGEQSKLATAVEIAAPDRRATTGQILRRVDFWLLVIAVGLLNGSGMVKLAQLVPLVAEQGRSIGDATLLLSISGGAGVIGSFAFGWLADRLGGAPALMLNALLQAATWTIFFLHPALPLLFVDAFIMGICGGGVFAAYMIVLVDLFGRPNLPRALGLAAPFGVIPTFVAPPIAGFLYDISGSYVLMLGTISSACLVVSMVMAILWMRQRRRQA